MAIARLFRKLADLTRKNPLRELKQAADIRQLLERERARSHRTGEPVTVVTFTPRTSDEDRTHRYLAAVLRRRIRSTDEAGWLNDSQICVVCPATRAQGAWILADHVCSEFPDDLPPPLCEVFAYPFETPEPIDGHTTTLSDRMRNTLPLESFFLRPVPFDKRALDFVVALTALVMLLPLFLVVAVAIKLTSRGPVLFRQRRTGRGGKPFTIYKFRTMVNDADQVKSRLRSEQDGPAFKMKKDPRVTFVGGYLRSTSLDELPQLWNILRGDMSLVGPRPLPCDEQGACRSWQMQRLDVTPGLTCIWQVFGRSRVSFEDWVRMDVRYIRSQSLWQDLKLLILTIPAVMLRKGAY